MLRVAWQRGAGPTAVGAVEEVRIPGVAAGALSVGVPLGIVGGDRLGDDRVDQRRAARADPVGEPCVDGSGKLLRASGRGWRARGGAPSRPAPRASGPAARSRAAGGPGRARPPADASRSAWRPPGRLRRAPARRPTPVGTRRRRASRRSRSALAARRPPTPPRRSRPWPDGARTTAGPAESAACGAPPDVRRSRRHRAGRARRPDRGSSTSVSTGAPVMLMSPSKHRPPTLRLGRIALSTRGNRKPARRSRQELDREPGPKPAQPGAAPSRSRTRPRRRRRAPRAARGSQG